MNNMKIIKGERMNKPLITGLVGIVLVAALLAGVHAYGQQFQQGSNSGNGAGQRGMQKGTCEYHDKMQTIMSTGTYADLVALREETGRPMMPFITDETSFAVMQEQHKEMIAQYGDDVQNGGCPMHQNGGAMRGSGAGKHNCPMMNN
jgi:hypothetical protein